jgi:hypothetical protein
MRLTSAGFCASLMLIGILVVAQRSQEPTDASLIQLIANPDKYDGKFVRVIGFVRLEFEGNAMYLHREDYENSLLKNAVWIDPTSEMMKQREKFDKKYVLLEGTFDAKRFGHMGLFSGELHQLKRADVWPHGQGTQK